MVAIYCRTDAPGDRLDNGSRGGPGAAGSPANEVARLASLAAANERAWLGRARPLGASAPAAARALYGRSLLTLRALTDSRTGASVAGARDGWAYVWPRDAATAAMAFAAAGYRGEARRVADFLFGLDLHAAARFDGDGEPVPGRAAQGDALGWTIAAARASATNGHETTVPTARPIPWRDRADYWEGDPADYLANAIASGAGVSEFEWPMDPQNSETSVLGLVRVAGAPETGLDSAAAWAVRPFARRALYRPARRTMLRLTESQTPFGITPGEGWDGGDDPWTAPTAWTAWSLAALARSDRAAGRIALARRERREALRLLADLERAATPAGALPERVDVRTGVPRSTTPLGWSHAFAVLALRELKPSGHPSR